LRSAYARVFERVDVLIGATSPSPAFRLGEHSSDPLTMYLCDVLTVPASLAGLPALTLPCGFDGGLPLRAATLWRMCSTESIRHRASCR
jgi:aspartyl-tRNA(Asn)/glutamyl-tRNA(Gln) amidotransferase subunit A